MIEFEFAGASYRYAEAAQEDCVTTLFDNDWLVANQRIRQQISTRGRGTVTLLYHQGQDYALKHYRRGGFIQRFSKDQYCWQGLLATRAWQEFSLLDTLTAKALPCPRPYACRVQRTGLLYRASLITAMIPETQTLAQHLEKKGLDTGQWRSVGRCIQAFHAAGAYHADLNADNILLDRHYKVYLIDFDKGALKKPARAWQFANLKRLQRSLMKYWMEADTFCFGPADWDSLRQGYLSAVENSSRNGERASR